MTATAALVKVSKWFGRHPALSDVSIAFDGSSIVGIVGPNGAGKATVLRIPARLIRPSEGTGNFAGERPLPPSASARRWMALWSADLATRTPKRRLGLLSRGSRQRIGLEAALLCPDPCLVVLDEPWEGLDPDASRWLSDT